MLIGTHLNPDGDALGSALALSLYLDHKGVANEVLCQHSAPDNLQFVPHVGRVRQVPSSEKYDLAVVVDLDAVDRLGSVREHFARVPFTIVVDHHVPHEAPGDYRIVDTSAPATAAILTEMFFESRALVTPDMATCLLTGIVTDTGSFRFRNTTPEALMLSARLLELGGDITLISEEVFHRKKLASARLLGHLLEHMRLECDEQVAYGILRDRDFERCGARDEDTEGFVNELLSVRTVQIAALAREHRPGRVRVSLRSRGSFDVAAVAREFGGGGHANAAGCSFDGDPEEAMAQLLPVIRQCLESS